MKKLMRNLLPALALVLFVSAPVMAEDGKRIFLRKGCTSCHGTDAKNTRAPAYPKLAGQHKDYIVAQLKEFKSKRRSSVRAKEMIPFANSLNEEQMNSVGDYLSGL